MKHTLYTLLAMALCATISFMAAPSAQAQILRLSPLVHNAPSGGYAFHALAPLPTVMPDQVHTKPVVYTHTSNGVYGNSGITPAVLTPSAATTVDLKKKL